MQAYDSQAEDNHHEVLRLPFAEQFVVWALRSVAHNRHCDCGNPVDIAAGFRLARAEAALPSLLAFMQIVDCAQERPINLHGVSCACISRDEQTLVDCVASLQAGYMASAHRMLHQFLPCAGARAAVWTLEAFACRVRDAGLVLSFEHFDDAAFSGGDGSVLTRTNRLH